MAPTEERDYVIGSVRQSLLCPDILQWATLLRLSRGGPISFYDLNAKVLVPRYSRLAFRMRSYGNASNNNYYL